MLLFLMKQFLSFVFVQTIFFACDYFICIISITFQQLYESAGYKWICPFTNWPSELLPPVVSVFIFIWFVPCLMLLSFLHIAHVAWNSPSLFIYFSLVFLLSFIFFSFFLLSLLTLSPSTHATHCAQIDRIVFLRMLSTVPLLVGTVAVELGQMTSLLNLYSYYPLSECVHLYLYNVMWSGFVLITVEFTRIRSGVSSVGPYVSQIS